MENSERASTGIPGLDAVLRGGWPCGRMYLLHGAPGTGKTTLGFQFLLEGVRRKERLLYITLSETMAEVRGLAASHGWDLDGIEIFDLGAAEQVLGLNDVQTMFDPSDVEFRATSRAIKSAIERVRPTRVVFDSLSEMSFLARDALAFRRELLLLKQTLMKTDTTVLLLSDGTAPDAERHLHSLAHGVLIMEELAPEYGAERRRMRVRKLRGSYYRGGFHDFRIDRGGIEVYPRLVAADHEATTRGEPMSSGNGGLDAMLGGGLARGTSTLLMGPAGTGKSNLVATFAHAAASQGETAAVFLFDEAVESFLQRAAALGSPLHEHVRSGRLLLRQVDPAELSPGELIHIVRTAVEQHGASFVAIDSLNGYTYAMPEEHFLNVQMHELLSYLSRRGVATCLVLTQAGLIGQMTAPADITYIADAVVLLRFFEAGGRVHRAISMLKKRTGAHGSEIRELRFGEALEVGEPLHGFEGVLTGVPRFTGDRSTLLSAAESHE